MLFVFILIYRWPCTQTQIAIAPIARLELAAATSFRSTHVRSTSTRNCCIQASRREYFGMSALLLRYISSSMFVVVTKGVPIRILRGLQSWFADFRLEIRRFEFYFYRYGNCPRV